MRLLQGSDSIVNSRFLFFDTVGLRRLSFVRPRQEIFECFCLKVFRAAREAHMVGMVLMILNSLALIAETIVEGRDIRFASDFAPED